MDSSRMEKDTAISDIYNKMEVIVNGNFKMGL